MIEIPLNFCSVKILPSRNEKYPSFERQIALSSQLKIIYCLLHLVLCLSNLSSCYAKFPEMLRCGEQQRILSSGDGATIIYPPWHLKLPGGIYNYLFKIVI